MGDKNEVKTTPIKQDEIQKCKCCGEGIGHNNSPFFYRLSLEQCVINFPAVQRQAGLEQMLNGNSALAKVFSPNENIAEGINMLDKIWICSDCMMKDLHNTLCLIEE